MIFQFSRQLMIVTKNENRIDRMKSEGGHVDVSFVGYK